MKSLIVLAKKENDKKAIAVGNRIRYGLQRVLASNFWTQPSIISMCKIFCYFQEHFWIPNMGSGIQNTQEFIKNEVLLFYPQCFGFKVTCLYSKQLLLSLLLRFLCHLLKITLPSIHIAILYAAQINPNLWPFIVCIQNVYRSINKIYPKILKLLNFDYNSYNGYSQ